MVVAGRLSRLFLLALALALALAACEQAPIDPGNDDAAAQTSSPTDDPTEAQEEKEDEPGEPSTVRLKNYVGKRLAQVRTALRSVGLGVQIRRRASDRPAGTILAQRPRAGEVRPGRTVTLIVAKPKPTPPNDCHPSYTGPGVCLDPNASDYDCAGGTGDGPRYTGRVTVVGPDVFDLDRDNDGVGCE